MKTTENTLITGCFIFKDDSVYVSEVYSLKRFNSESEAEEFGENYLDNGGDSYLIVETENNIEWDEEAKRKYGELKK